MVVAKSSAVKAGAKVTKKKIAKKKSSPPVGQGVGRRKRAVARVWLRPGKGTVVVNGRDLENYFPREIDRFNINIPMEVCPFGGRYDIAVNVSGGGMSSQAGAIRLGISRAFVGVDSEVKPALKEHSLLTVDSRVTERKKYGQRGARRKFQFVKR